MKIRKKIFLTTVAILALSISQNYARHAIILIHGAFSAKNTWMVSGGKFYKAIQKATNDLATIKSFFWDQPFHGIFAFEKIDAAKKLADLIIDLRKSGHTLIDIYAHSYGGHVTSIASQLLNNNQGKLEISLNPKSMDVTRSINLKKDVNEYPIANIYFMQAYKEIQQKVQQLKIHTRSGVSEYFINIVHTLGTPNEEAYFHANMSTIAYLINGWSKGDITQGIVGDHKLAVDHERSTNLEYLIPEQHQDNDGWLDMIGDLANKIFFEPIGWDMSPNHLEMRSRIVGKWLPDIPFILMNEKINGFENFTFQQDGIIEFSLDKHLPPSYRVEPSA